MLLVLFNKFLGKRRSSHPNSNSIEAALPEQQVVRIQQGDLRLRNQFIADYQPYVAKVTSRFCKRYVDPARDDEFSIALAAFNEAINQFAPQAGRSFLSFAETVMRRRLIDFVRKEQRFRGQVPLSSFEVEDDEDNIINPVEVHQAIELYEKQRGLEERKGEIADFSRVLAEFGVSFTELAEVAPKHEDSRRMLLRIGHTLAGSSAMMRILVTKRTLPIKELLEQVDVSRKTLERNRKYLIAMALILNGPYPYLRDYLRIHDEEDNDADAPAGRRTVHE
ncbi:RNA polymerase sigma factor SigI [Paenibacillus chartarius]|uniref:RNA polymerase sigma factor SigI n=1 Tax=Paenibacillus chartarius TaxID=747481 RepID=A0ABV6DPF7_9BACL